MPFIFSRRHIQHCLDVLQEVLTINQHSDLVRKLNRRNPQRLAAMWEAVVLTCFTDLPGFMHEEPLENGRKPDFQFRLSDTGAHVVGDITSVSDKRSKKDNPIEFFIEDIGRIAEKQGSDRSQFHVQVNAKNVGDYSKRRVILKLPKGQDNRRFLKEELRPYIIERLNAEDYGHKKVFNSGEYDVEVTFQPKSQLASYSYPNFTSVIHIDKNPVWNALKDKAEQLRSAPAGALRVLILCDGGCAAMHDRGLSSSIGGEKIVREFLKRKTGIDIVITMTVKDERKLTGQFRIAHEWSWLQSDAINSAAATELQQVINTFKNRVPKPVSNAESAVKSCLIIDYGIGAWGGYKMAGNKIEISARALQRVLSGEVSIEEFNNDHGWLKENPFARALSSGQTISNISMACEDEGDDDYIEIAFAPDAALSPFN